MENKNEFELKDEDVQEILDDLKKLAEPKLVIEKDGTIYELLKSDGLVLSQAGWSIKLPDGFSVSDIFYSYCKVRDQNGDEVERIEPFLLVFQYDNDGKIVSKRVEPLKALHSYDFGNIIARIEKGSISEVGLETLMSLDTAKELMEENVEVDLKMVYESLRNKAKEYFFLRNPIEYDIIVLWIIGTYYFDIFNVFPILFVLGPSGCGKTRIIMFIAYTSRHGFLITNPTEANLPRIIEAFRPSLAIDDFDEIMQTHKPMVFSILKHTYKNTVKIPRLDKVTKGSKFILSLFRPFSPLSFNSTEPILDTQLLTRQIRLNVEKRDDMKFPTKDPDIYLTQAERQLLYKARFIYAPRVYEIFSELDSGLYGRFAEIWAPILTIAKLLSDDLFEAVKSYALRYVGDFYTGLYLEEKMIIRALKKLLNNSNVVEVTASTILSCIKDILQEDDDLSEKEIDREWNTRKVGRILERLGIPLKRSKERLRIVTKETVNKLAQTFDVTDEIDDDIGYTKDKDVQTYDVTDVFDVNIGYTKGKDLEQNVEKTPKIAEKTLKITEKNQENLDTSMDVSSCMCTIVTSENVETSTGEKNNPFTHEERYFLRKIEETHDINEARLYLTEVLKVSEKRAEKIIKNLADRGVISEVKPGHYIVNTKL